MARPCVEWRLYVRGQGEQASILTAEGLVLQAYESPVVSFVVRCPQRDCVWRAERTSRAVALRAVMQIFGRVGVGSGMGNGASGYGLDGALQCLLFSLLWESERLAAQQGSGLRVPYAIFGGCNCSTIRSVEVMPHGTEHQHPCGCECEDEDGRYLRTCCV